MKVIIPAGEILHKPNVPGKLGVAFPDQFKSDVQMLLSAAGEKGITQLRWEISLPHRRRSSGPRSQNSRLHGHCQDIADQLGEDYTAEMVKEAFKRMAVSEGYPTVYNAISGNEEPKPTRNATVEECMIVQQVLQLFADEHGLYLTEYDSDGPYKSIGGRSREEMATWQT